MKRFMFILAMLFMFNANVEARDIYVGTSPATGYDCYVMTETINKPNSSNFWVTLKMRVYEDEVQYLNYEFWYDERDRRTHFSNNQGFVGIADQNETPIEYNIARYVWANY